MKKLVSSQMVLLAMAAGCTTELPEKPNILFITTDYQSWEDTPELTPVLRMPALERLEKEGVVFENHYCTAPVSMPSRYTIVTGTYPHTHGMWDNGSGWVPDGSPILMEEMKKQGYQTVGIGKMHFSPWSRMAGFDERIIADCQGNGAGDTLKKDDYYYYLRKAGKTRFDYLRYQDSSEVFGVYDWPMDDTLDIDYFVGDQTVKYIRDGKLKGPWFLWVSFNGPHNPWDPPAEYSEYYMNNDLPGPRYIPGELENKPFEHTIMRFNYTRKVVDRLDQYPDERDNYIKRIRAGHYGGLTWIDEQVGKILKEMESQGLLKNTIVVFSADHGTHLGDHDLIHKGTLYERSAHVPFIMWWPGVLKPGKFTGYSGHINILPTFIELAGGSVPGKAEGTSLVPVLEKKEKPADHAFIEIHGSTAYVSDKYKFGLYRQYREGDLYDRKKDPDEFVNLYSDQAFGKVVDELSQVLLGFDTTLQTGIEKAKEVKPLPTNITFKQGDVAGMGEGPYLSGKAFTIKVDIEVKKGDSGPVFTNVEGQHGFSVYIMGGDVFMSFRTWGKVKEYPVIKGFVPGEFSFICRLDKDGKLSVSDKGGKLLSSFDTDWPKPYQDGRHEYLTGIYRAGVNGQVNNRPGRNERGNDFTGKINQVELIVDP